MKKLFIRICGFAVAISLLSGSLSVGAAEPYYGYNYNAWNKSVAAPNSYRPIEVYGGLDLSDCILNNPDDIFITDNGLVYISDSGNNRILVCDENMKLQRVISKIKLTDGTEEDIKGPDGLFVDNEGDVYITLPEQEKVVRIDKDDKFVCAYTCPDSEYITDNMTFKPINVVVNKLGTVFILVDGLYLGAVTYDKEGKFLGFYGANEVNVTLELLASYAWKKILSQKQINKMERYVPVSYSGFDIDEDNFIYTVTNDAKDTYDEIQKLNSLGDNVMIPFERNVSSSTGDYGDLERAVYMGSTVDTAFIDVCVDKNGLIFALDKTQGRIFEYDQESRLLSIFGSSGYQKGGFKNAVSIDCYNNKVYVLDKDKGTITIFAPTEYGSTVEEAVLLYNDGKYEDAKQLWEQVLEQNINCELAYIGIGKALYEEGKYKQALTYFEKGYDRSGHSRAYKEYRMAVAKVYFPYAITIVIISAVIGRIIFGVCRKKRRKNQ